MSRFSVLRKGSRVAVSVYIDTSTMKMLRQSANEMNVPYSALVNVILKKSLSEERDDGKVILSKAKVEQLQPQAIQEALRRRARDYGRN